MSHTVDGVKSGSRASVTVPNATEAGGSLSGGVGDGITSVAASLEGVVN